MTLHLEWVIAYGCLILAARWWQKRKAGAVVSVEFFEFSDRVVRVEITPDGEGFIRRTMTAEVVNGPPFTLEEYEAISAAVVADMISRGCDVHRWGGIPEDSE